jgi:thiol peroxidase
MGQVTFKGGAVPTAGSVPAVGSKAPAFTLTGKDLSDVKLADLAGKKVVLNIFPSIDTPVCALSVKRFNAEASSLANTVVLCVSVDLPFAAGRFCAAEGLEKVVIASAFRSPDFGKDYGVLISGGPLAGLFSRAVVIVDGAGKVAYAEHVSEITHEPNYEAALKALK